MEQSHHSLTLKHNFFKQTPGGAISPSPVFYKFFKNEEKTIAPGESVIFYDIPADGYIIQGMSADGQPHTFQLHYYD